jgi:hypothetical protein
MVSLLRTLLRAATNRGPKLVCESELWNRGVDELRRRTGGTHESGAFLLGDLKGEVRRLRQFLFYDDIDPNCFANGIVEFDGSKFGLVWDKCRALSMAVVADVHVHPRGFRQSPSDRRNPMIAEVGHIALILPHYASRARVPGMIGVYEYLGSRRWRDWSSAGDRAFHVGWWPR